MLRPISIRSRIGFTTLSVSVLVLTAFSDKSLGAESQAERENLELQRSIDRIHTQQEAEVQRASIQTAKDIARRDREVQWQIQALHNRNAEALAEMQRAGTYYPDRYGTSHWVPTYTPQQITDTYQRMQDQERLYAMTDHGQSQISANVLHRANALEVDAANLQSQLNSDKSKHGFKLSPVGTNLYVRNYQVGGDGDDDDAEYNSYTPAGAKNNPAAMGANPGRLPSAPPGSGRQKTPNPTALQAGRLPATRAPKPSGISSRAQGKSGKIVQTTVTGQFLKP